MSYEPSQEAIEQGAIRWLEEAFPSPHRVSGPWPVEDLSWARKIMREALLVALPIELERLGEANEPAPTSTEKRGPENA